MMRMLWLFPISFSCIIVTSFAYDLSEYFYSQCIELHDHLFLYDVEINTSSCSARCICLYPSFETNTATFLDSSFSSIIDAKSVMFCRDQGSRVIVIQEAHVPKVDKHSKSDAYIVVYLNDRMIGKTDVIHNSHEPFFNSSFDIAFASGSDWIRFVIMDDDGFEEHDFIASIAFRLKDIPKGKTLTRKFKHGWVRVRIIVPVIELFDSTYYLTFSLLSNGPTLSNES